jgi:hypothetical protein
MLLRSINAAHEFKEPMAGHMAAQSSFTTGGDGYSLPDINLTLFSGLKSNFDLAFWSDLPPQLPYIHIHSKSAQL